MKKDLSFNQLAQLWKRLAHPLARHFYFFYLMVLLVGVGVCVIFIAISFGETDTEYEIQKQQAILRDVQLNKDKATVDHILQLQTAGTGPIKPNYVPSRDNPFAE